MTLVYRCERCGEVFERHRDSGPKVPTRPGIADKTQWATGDACDNCTPVFRELLDLFWSGKDRIEKAV